MRYEYTVYLLDLNGRPVQSFTYTDYDDVQNLIGYMVDGARCLNITISKEIINE